MKSLEPGTFEYVVIGHSTPLVIEEKRDVVIDFATINELSTFSRRGNSYQAESGCHDDLVMGLTPWGVFGVMVSGARQGTGVVLTSTVRLEFLPVDLLVFRRARSR